MRPNIMDWYLELRDRDTLDLKSWTMTNFNSVLQAVEASRLGTGDHVRFFGPRYATDAELDELRRLGAESI